MESTVSFDTKIDEIIRENKIFRFALELQNTTDETRKELIKHKLKILQGTSILESNDMAKSQLDNIYDKIDNFRLKQKWTKLNDKQKQERITNFIKMCKITELKKIRFQEKISEMIKNKLFKPSYIDYDDVNGVINNIVLPDFNLDSDSDTDSDTDTDLDSDSDKKKDKKKHESDSDDTSILSDS